MRISRGQGKVEYLAHKPTIQAFLDEGYTLHYIYQKLKAEGKLTLSYVRLSVLVADKKNKKSQKLSDLNKPRTSIDTHPRIIRAETSENPFRQDRTKEDLYKKLIG